MKIEIRKLKPFKGSQAHIYSVVIDEDRKTRFELFYEMYQFEYRLELESIRNKLQVMNYRTGTQEYFFKANEGKPGDGVVALYDSPSKKLRLYCIRYGNSAIILGGGGSKAKSIKAYQEDPLLNKEAQWIKKVSQMIFHAMRDGDISLDNEGNFIGNLTIENDE